MDDLLSFVLSMILLLVALFVIWSVAGSQLPGLAEINRTEGVKIAMNRISGILAETGDAEACYTVSGNYDYDFHLKTFGILSPREMEVFPVISFKGERQSSDVWLLEEGSSQVTDLHYTIKSSEPPMIKWDTLFYENNEPIPLGQKILIGNFIVEFSDILELKLNLPLLPDIEAIECTAYLAVTCQIKQGSFIAPVTESVFLKLKDDEPCYTQENKDDCTKDLVMCSGETYNDAEIRIELVRFESPGSQCPEKNPRISISIPSYSEGPRKAVEWKKDGRETAGEEFLVSFWMKDENPENDDCWQSDIFDIRPACTDLLVGVFQGIIPAGERCTAGA